MNWNTENIVKLLQSIGEEEQKLFAEAALIKKENVGNVVYFRGLIEYSNICSKNCYYCGIRRNNQKILRYTMADEEVLEAAIYAHTQGYGSIVLQSGEIESEKFTQKIEDLLKKITGSTKGELGITLSLGEQEEKVLEKWKNAGASRYLLRIETSNPDLYRKIHPNNSKHSFEQRVQCLKTIQELGYQAGTGVMIGLPFQTDNDLANDLLFFKEINYDMFGMGPYIEHSETPLYQYRQHLMPLQQRFDLTLKMIAVLRIMLKNVNIAATTAMQAIDPNGREKAIEVGANVIMPNLNPIKYRDKYLLYEDKPCLDEHKENCKSCLEMRIHLIGEKIGYFQKGDSKHYEK
ncbi:MAG: [FeFe] hydrogenase H-cluster radical SAM maturase HydE [Bacteroidales bacterium]|jgi:biotin synthase|nr:[FeFe] hydrogenase H-cluster radical SAM maturase HydE [Bacteroidales bacterium]